MNTASCLSLLLSIFLSSQANARVSAKQNLPTRVVEVEKSPSQPESAESKPGIYENSKEAVQKGWNFVNLVGGNALACENSGGKWSLDMTLSTGGFCIEAPPECQAHQTVTPSPSSYGPRYICTSKCSSGEEYVRVGPGSDGGVCQSQIVQEENSEDENCGGPLTPCEEPENLRTVEQCRAAQYQYPDCQRNEEFQAQYQRDVETISAKRSELEAACQESSIRVSNKCSTYSQDTTAAAQATSNAGDNACRLAQQAPESQSTVSEYESSCTQQQGYCEQSCNASQSVLWATVSGSAKASLCGQSASPHLLNMQQQKSALASHQNNAQRRCDQLAGNSPDEDTSGANPPVVTPNGNPSASPVASYDASTDDGYSPSETRETSRQELGGGGINMGSVLSDLGSLASGMSAGGSSEVDFGRALPAPPSFKSGNSQANESSYGGGGRSGSGGSYNKSSNNLDLSGTTSGGDDLRNLTDLGNSRGNDSEFTPQGAKSNDRSSDRQGSAAGTSTNPQSAQLSSSDGGGGGGAGRGRKVRRNSVQGRNLIGGYKNVKANDGGGALSIRPSDMKRYGVKNMKAKLNAARKTFGLKVPLMFRNGKFVRDFLALKESKEFKSRQAAMESYWKGNNKNTGSGEHACVSLNECHTNEKANIFKLMNFRLQKSFYKVNIDI